MAVSPDEVRNLSDFALHVLPQRIEEFPDFLNDRKQMVTGNTYGAGRLAANS